MISEYLSLFGRIGKVFKAVVFDSDKEENPTVTTINDINKGSIHNALEWHGRWISRLVEEFPLTMASGKLLNDWGEFLGIRNDEGFNDPEYRSKILAKILAIVGTKNVILNSIPSGSDVFLREGSEIGWFLDAGFLDTPVYPDRMVGSTLVHQRNSLYLLFRTLYDIDAALLRALYQIKSAGIGIYAGAIVELPTYINLFTDSGFIDRDYLGD